MAERMSVMVLSRIAYEVGTDILPPVKDLRDVVAEAVRARAAEEFEHQRADENAADARALEARVRDLEAQLKASGVERVRPILGLLTEGGVLT